MLFHDFREATDKAPKIFQYTLCPQSAACVSLDFNLVSSALQEDFIQVYEGEGMQGTLLASWGGKSGSRYLQIKSTCITIVFDRTGPGLNSVWTALWKAQSEAEFRPGAYSNKQYQDICGMLYRDPFQYYGSANKQEADGLACMDAKHNTALYRFVIARDGDLDLSILPNNHYDDLDWVLWRANPDSAGMTHPDTLGERMACNYAPGRGVGGETGTRMAAKPWNPANPHSPFSSSVPVKKGEVYFLMIDDFSGHCQGLEIHFNDVIMPCYNSPVNVFDLGSVIPTVRLPTKPPAFISNNVTLRLDLSTKTNRPLAQCPVEDAAYRPMQAKGKQLPVILPGENANGICHALLKGLRAGCLRAYRSGGPLYPLHYGDLLDWANQQIIGSYAPWPDEPKLLAPMTNYIELLVNQRFDQTTGRNIQEICYLRLLWVDRIEQSPDYVLALFRYDEVKPLLDGIRVPHPHNDAGTMSLADYLEQQLFEAVVVDRAGARVRNLAQAQEGKPQQLEELFWGR